MTYALTPYRRGLIASVKIAQKDMGLDDATYRALLDSVCGKDSATTCSNKELVAVLAEMRAKGWNPQPRPPQKTAPKDPLAPLRNKIKAQLAALDKPAAYADGILQRMYGDSARVGSTAPAGPSVATANREQLTAVIAALTRQQARVA